MLKFAGENGGFRRIEIWTPEKMDLFLDLSAIWFGSIAAESKTRKTQVDILEPEYRRCLPPADKHLTGTGRSRGSPRFGRWPTCRGERLCTTFSAPSATEQHRRCSTAAGPAERSALITFFPLNDTAPSGKPPNR